MSQFGICPRWTYSCVVFLLKYPSHIQWIFQKKILFFVWFDSIFRLFWAIFTGTFAYASTYRLLSSWKSFHLSAQMAENIYITILYSPHSLSNRKCLRMLPEFLLSDEREQLNRSYRWGTEPVIYQCDNLCLCWKAKVHVSSPWTSKNSRAKTSCATGALPRRNWTP